MSQKGAVTKVVDALKEGRFYFGPRCEIIAARIEYEDRGRRDSKQRILLSPTWRVDVRSGDTVANVYVPALHER